ncbi:hypothetical protein V6N13_021037 [Hibiscus sabdariffa]
MTKRTKKAGIVGKYAYLLDSKICLLGVPIKKREVSQHSKYFCEFCGKYAVKRKAVGIWGCKDCGKVKAGGAYTLNTASAVTVRSTIRCMSFVDDIPPHGGRYCHHTNQVLSSLDDVEELHPQGFVTRYIAKVPSLSSNS